MIKIYSGGDKISYTEGDTFLLTVQSAENFEDGSKLKLQVAENEDSNMLIDSLYNLEDGVFQINLTEDEKKSLALGTYIYRIVLLDVNGGIVTQKSGELEVKWGA